MNKKFTKLIAALALLVFMTPSLAGWGQTSSSVTMAYSGSTTTNMTGNNDAALVGLDATDWSVVGAKGSNSNFPGLNKAGDIRLYYHQDGSNTITVTALNDNFTISNIVITYTSPDYNNGKVFVGDNEVTLSNGAYAINSTSFVVTNGNTSNVQVRISNIVISYTSGGGTTTYTVTFDCDGGTGCPEDITGIEEGDDNFTVPSVTPTKEHYAFDNFYIGSDDEMYEPGETYTIESDLELTASWTINKNNVTLNDDNTAAELYAEYGENMLIEGETVAINYGTELALGADNLPANHIVVWTVKNTSNVDVTADVLSGTTVTVPDYAIIITGTVTEIPTYTINFIAGSGTCETASISGLEGSSITLPPANPSENCATLGWTFAGWATASVSETTTAPTLLSGEYTITGNATLYAVYKVTEGDGGSFEYDFSQQGYTNAQIVYNAVMDATSGIGWAATKGTNDPAYYDTGNGLRIYNGGTFKITTNNNTITAVSLTFAGDGYTFNSSDANPTTWSGSQSTDITWNVGRTCRLQKVNVTYGLSTTTYNSNPDCLEQVATPTFSLEEGTYTGSQNVTISCTTDGATILYKTSEEGQWQTYSTAIPVSTTTTIWAKATKDGMDDSDEAEATYTIKYTLTLAENEDVLPLLFDGEENPIEIDDETGTATIEAGTEVRVSIDMIANCLIYDGLTVTGVNDINEIIPNVYYSFSMPTDDATLTVNTTAKPTHTLTVGTLSHVTLELTAGEESNEVQSGDELCEGIHVTVVATPAAGYVMGSVSVVYGNNQQSVDVTTEGENTYSFYMPTGNATINVTVEEYVAPLGGTITFGSAEGSTKIEGATSSGTGTVTYTDTGNDSNGNAWTITTITSKTKYFSQNPSYSQVGSSNNPVNSITFTTTFTEPVVITDFQAKFGGFSNTAGTITLEVGETTVGTGSLNATADVIVSNSSVASGTTLTVTVTNIAKGVKCYYISYEYLEPLHINGHNGGAGGWYLIASPVTDLTPSSANGFITDTYGSSIPEGESGTYDLYYFDQTGGENGKEWKNYRQHNFNLESGKGYLYASKEGTDLIFAGTAYSGDGVVNLTYSEWETIDDNMRGWNLIGNPFGTTATLPSGLSYYTLNESRTELVAGNATTIGAMKAIFVKATATGQSVTFTKQTRNVGSNAILSLNLSSVSNGLIDRAIVRFDEGNALPKFMINPNNTKVFIPVEGKDYAVVRNEAQGEMPVKFRANENGEYTLTVDPENVEMNYLHLIDNMTGADIDLLQTPSYSFNATTTDYESRFRLVFAANNEDGASTGSAAFAFYSNGNWIISNAGEATLQVVDVTGRILSSETVNGSVSKTINATSGVYMLRLINGENVKVQKIVVR